MKNIEQLKAKIQSARAVEDASTAIMLEFIQDFRSKKSAIYSNREFSEIGQTQQIKKLSSDYERKALELSAELRSLHRGELEEARAAAEKIVLSEVPKIDDRTKKIFAMKSDALQAKVTFATSPTAAVAALEELVAAASEHPALSAEMKGLFVQLSQQAISLEGNHNEALRLRKKLGQLHENLSQNALTEDAREAAAIVEQAEAMKDTALLTLPVTNALLEVSQFTRHYANSPEEYFDRNGGVE